MSPDEEIAKRGEYVTRPIIHALMNTPGLQGRIIFVRGGTGFDVYCRRPHTLLDGTSYDVDWGRGSLGWLGLKLDGTTVRFIDRMDYPISTWNTTDFDIRDPAALEALVATIERRIKEKLAKIDRGLKDQ